MSQISLDLTQALAPPREAAPRDAAPPGGARGDDNAFAERLQDATNESAREADNADETGDTEVTAETESLTADTESEPAAEVADEPAAIEQQETTDDEFVSEESIVVEAPIAVEVVVTEPVVQPTETVDELIDETDFAQAIAPAEDAEDDGGDTSPDPAPLRRVQASEQAFEGDAEASDADATEVNDADTPAPPLVEEGPEVIVPADGEESLPPQVEAAAIPTNTDALRRDASAVGSQPGAATEGSASAAEPIVDATSTDAEQSGEQDGQPPSERETPLPRVGPGADATPVVEPSVEAPVAEAASNADAADTQVNETSPSTSRNDTNTNAALTRIAAGRVDTQQTPEDAGPRIDASRFVSRVAGAFQAAQERGGEIRLRLSPPELGVLQVRIAVSEGVLTAALETENNTARNALLDNLPALRERLAEQGISIEKFDVDVRDEGAGGRQDEYASNDRRDEQSRDGRGTPSDSPTREQTSAVSDSRPTIEPSADGRINLVA